jgi:anti-sigma regulatory factor (Ser/Thr protein kinase)
MAKYTLTVTSELENLESIARFVADATSTMGMDADTTYAVQLAVDEACTNVIDYAYQRRRGQPVTIECREENGQCIVVIRDCGRPFDPRHVPMPDLKGPISRRKVGGLGIFLMRKLMDDVHFRFDVKTGNEVTLVKGIKQRLPHHAEESSSAGKVSVRSGMTARPADLWRTRGKTL